MKKIILACSADISTNERVHLFAHSLTNAGYSVRVISFKTYYNRPLPFVEYKVNRIHIFFFEGILGKINRLISYFFYLLSKKAKVIVCMDQGALIPVLLVHAIKRTQIVFDYSGNYLDSKISGAQWQNDIHSILFKWFHNCFKCIIPSSQKIREVLLASGRNATVPIYDLPLEGNYERFSKNFNEVYEDAFWNVPPKGYDFWLLRRIILAFLNQEKRKVILYIGPIEKNLGLEALVRSMEYVDDACLLMIGTGKYYEELKYKVKRWTFWEKVLMPGIVRYDQLREFIPLTDLGICLGHSALMEMNINVSFSFARFLHSGIPVVTNVGSETNQLLVEYHAGNSIEFTNPEQIGKQLNEVLKGNDTLIKWKEGAKKFAKKMDWNQQEKIFLDIFKQLG
ncbi:MAG: glycosyltransferase [Bacteroidota bacterium]|nr:glycosyltransferase [Bacteroidota bacterium]